jgi:hypothetical protein
MFFISLDVTARYCIMLMLTELRAMENSLILKLAGRIVHS